MTSTETVFADERFPALRDHITAATGLVFTASRSELLASQVGSRLEEQHLDKCLDYLQLLQNGAAGAAELDRLVARLTIGETYFFRHQEVFDSLRDAVLPEIIARNSHSRRIRIWSAGCSIGAEPYSLSILLRRDLAHLLHDWNISILGTDINRGFLAHAENGTYEEWAFRGTSPALRQQCFQSLGSRWQIDPRFRQGVAFHYHNLAADRFPAPDPDLAAFDLILCRNVLIYFDPHFAVRVASRLADLIVPNGWLVLGHAEHGPHLHAAFETVPFTGGFLYRKKGAAPKCTTPHPPQTCPYAGPKLQLPWDGNAHQAILHAAHRISPPTDSALPAAIPNITKAAGTVSTPLQHVCALANEGRFDDALLQCRSQIDREPLDPNAHFYEAMLLDSVGQHAPALRSLQKTIYLDRNYALAYFYAGLIHEKHGHASEALHAYRNLSLLLARRAQGEQFPNSGGLSVADLHSWTQSRIRDLESTWTS